MEEAIKNNHETEANEDNVPEKRTTLHGKHHSQTSTSEDCVSVHKETEQSCFYKPLASPMLRQRKQPISMFEIQPSVTEIIEVQEICIETGAQQCVKESVTVLPELTSSVQISDETKLPSELHTNRSVPTTSDKKPEISDSCQDLRKVVVGKDNGWIGSGLKLDTPRIPTCPATPPVSPSIRRRSLGVLKTPAWGLRMYRDPEKIENKSSPSLRRRSLVLHVQGKQSPCSLRRKYLVSPDVTELTSRKDCMNYNQLSNSAEDLRKPSDEKQLGFENENNAQDESQKDINNRVTENKTNTCSDDDEFEDFRPRLRSRSLDDSRTLARENVLHNFNRQKRSHHEPSKRKESRRKSFEVWLTDKEQETIRKLQMLALEKQQATEDELKRKEQCRRKTYEEWLSEKNNMAAVKNESSGLKQDETTKQGRQEIAKRRYDKWLMEKETQAFEEEREMLKEAKLKTVEMRKKYEEKKKNKLRFLRSSLF